MLTADDNDIASCLRGGMYLRRDFVERAGS